MTSAVLITLVILLSSAQVLACRLFSNHYPGDASASSSVFSIVSGFAVVLTAFAVNGFTFDAQPLTILCGVLNAAVIVGYNFCVIAASRTGPYSIQMTFTLAGNILIPTLSALIFDPAQKVPSVMSWISIGVIILSIFLINRKENEQKVKSALFLPACIGLFLTNGLFGALLNVQQLVSSVENKDEMIILTYSLSCLFFTVYALCKRRKKFLSDFRQTKTSLLFLILCALAMAFSTNLLVFILKLVDTAVFFTFNNAGILLCSVLAARLLFKERFSKTNVVGCALMCLALVGVSVF